MRNRNMNDLTRVRLNLTYLILPGEEHDPLIDGCHGIMIYIQQQLGE